MSGTARFWDKHAEGYAKKPVADEAAYQKKLEITRGYFRPDMQLLEFGCGTGSTAILHAPHVAGIRAIDISRGMLDIAERKAAAAGIETIAFEQAGIENFESPDASYDMILGLSILHLLERKEDALAKVFRFLKPGGLFVSSTVCLGNGMSYFKFIVPIGKALGLMPTVKVFTVDALERSLTEAGFAIERRWQPGEGKSSFRSVFLVARKPEAA